MIEEIGRATLRALERMSDTEEIKRHFSVVAESLRSEIRAVAEGLDGFRQEVASEFKLVREEIAETRAVIRLSFGELDRRIRSLEEDIGLLRARLDRIEGRGQA